MIIPPIWLHSSQESQQSHFGSHQDHQYGTILEQYIINTIGGAGEKEFRTLKKISSILHGSESKSIIMQILTCAVGPEVVLGEPE